MPLLPALSGRLGDGVAVQGNLDPNVLFAPPEAVAREADRIRAELAAQGIELKDSAQGTTWVRA